MDWEFLPQRLSGKHWNNMGVLALPWIVFSLHAICSRQTTFTTSWRFTNLAITHTSLRSKYIQIDFITSPNPSKHVSHVKIKGCEARWCISRIHTNGLLELKYRCISIFRPRFIWIWESMDYPATNESTKTPPKLLNAPLFSLDAFKFWIHYEFSLIQRRKLEESGIPVWIHFLTLWSSHPRSEYAHSSNHLPVQML